MKWLFEFQTRERVNFVPKSSRNEGENEVTMANIIKTVDILEWGESSNFKFEVYKRRLLTLYPAWNENSTEAALQRGLL